MNLKKLLALTVAAALVLCLGLTGCDKDKDINTNDPYAKMDYGFQMELPNEGDTVAIMHTSMGDISIRLFPEAAPKTVENFTTHAKNGYYDGLTFHRVIKDFMVQGGDPKGDGTGGESIWGEPFEDEFSNKLMNLRGSLAMANSGVATNGSQFFINQAGPIAGLDAKGWAKKFNYDTMMSAYQGYYEQYAGAYGPSFTAQFPDLESFVNEYAGGVSPDSRLVPDEVWELYAQYGGNIHLDGAWRKSGGHTVFGQVYEGMDIVDKIAAVPVDESDKPTTPVTVKSIEITTYKK